MEWALSSSLNNSILVSIPRAAVLLLQAVISDAFLYSRLPRGGGTTFMAISLVRELTHRGCGTCSGSHSRKQRGGLTPESRLGFCLPTFSFSSILFWFTDKLPDRFSASASETQFWPFGKIQMPRPSPPWSSPCPPHPHISHMPSRHPRLSLAGPGSLWFLVSAMFSPLLPGYAFLPWTQPCPVPSAGSIRDILLLARCHPQHIPTRPSLTLKHPTFLLVS